MHKAYCDEAKAVFLCLMQKKKSQIRLNLRLLAEMVGFEPTSKSSFITASPITFRILTFPQYHAYGQAGYISSFMNFPIPQSLSTGVSRWMIPDLKGTGNLKAGSCL